MSAHRSKRTNETSQHHFVRRSLTYAYWKGHARVVHKPLNHPGRPGGEGFSPVWQARGGRWHCTALDWPSKLSHHRDEPDGVADLCSTTRASDKGDPDLPQPHAETSARDSTQTASLCGLACTTGRCGVRQVTGRVADQPLRDSAPNSLNVPDGVVGRSVRGSGTGSCLFLSLIPATDDLCLFLDGTFCAQTSAVVLE